MTQVKHTIQKLTVDVQTSSVSLGHEIRENARLFIDKHVIPLIESHLSKLQTQLSEQEILQLDRLTVDISTSPGQWNDDATALELQTVFERSLEETTRAIQAQRSMQNKVAATQTSGEKRDITGTSQVAKIKDRKEHLLDTWMNILESGLGSLSSHLQNIQSPSDLEEELLGWVKTTSREKQVQLSKCLSRKTVQQRLINQYSQAFVVRLLEIVLQPAGSLSSKIDKKADPPAAWNMNMPETLRRSFWLKLLDYIPFDKETVPTDSKMASELFNWLNASSSITNLTPDSGKKEWLVLLKRLSMQEKGELYSRIEKNNLSTKEERYVERAILSVLTIEWLHRLIGKDEPLSTYGTLLTTLLAPLLQTGQSITEKKTSASSEQSTVETRETSVVNSETEKLLTEQEEFTQGNAENEQNEQNEIPPVNQASEREEKLKPVKSDELSGKMENNTSMESQDNELSVKSGVRETGLESQHDETLENNLLSKSTESDGNQLSDNREKSVTGQEEKHSSETASKQKSLKEIPSHTIRKLQEDGGFVWVQNAGVILTHPFLKHLFSRTGILNDANELTDPVLAAHVLHFVASGIESDFEQDMVLEKLLCGLAPEDSIPREVPISEEIRNEVDGFFEAVKSNWKPLSTSSNEAMRETFFRREGKLLMDESGLRLIVERKTVDILLNQLTWPVSIVRLPWLKDIIYVEW